MSSATSNKTMLAANWKAGMVMPRNLKIHLPATAKTINTPAITQQARPAMRTRCSGVSVGVMARKAGTVASGSTMTKSELAARRTYSASWWLKELIWLNVKSLNRAGGEDSISHAVNDFFVGWTYCG